MTDKQAILDLIEKSDFDEILIGSLARRFWGSRIAALRARLEDKG